MCNKQLQTSVNVIRYLLRLNYCTGVNDYFVVTFLCEWTHYLHWSGQKQRRCKGDTKCVRNPHLMFLNWACSKCVLEFLCQLVNWEPSIPEVWWWWWWWSSIRDKQLQTDVNAVTTKCVGQQAFHKDKEAPLRKLYNWANRLATT